MEQRRLGPSSISIPPLVFGGNVLGWSADEATSFKLLDQCVEAGLNAIDTADVYSRWVPGHQGGESETIIGRWLKKRGKRDDVKILTKCGMEMPGRGKGLSPAWIKQAIDDSLKRLQTDYVDLYQAHADDASTPLADTLATFGELIRAGKVRAIGASRKRWKPVARTTCRPMSRCSRTTIWSSGRSTRMRWRRSARSTSSASFPTIRSPAVS
jgi:aryl-alcohol dehydrogenase-like predicted oxidoreductase